MIDQLNLQKKMEAYNMNQIINRVLWVSISLIPTRPKRTQYNAAYIGKGIDAKTAPNFPANRHVAFWIKKENLTRS